MAILHFLLPPWQFKSPSWEKTYQREIRSSFQGSKKWIALAACPSYVTQFYCLFQLQDCPAKLEVSKGMMSGAYIISCLLLCANWVYPAGKIARIGASPISISVRIFSAAVAYDICFGSGDPESVFDLSIRWIAMCSLGVPTFEEALAWSLLILGSRPFYTWAKGSLFESAVDETTLLAFSIAVITFYWSHGLRRRLWLRELANRSAGAGTCPLHLMDMSIKHEGSGPKDTIPRKLADPGGPTDHCCDATSLMHDDYFSVADWTAIAPIVEKEGVEICKRGSNTESRSLDVCEHEWDQSGKLLGQGSFGTVLFTRSVRGGVPKSTRPGQLFAMKVLRGKRESALSEGEMLQLLDHPNIVSFVDEVTLQKKSILVLELCDGGNVQRLIDRFGAVDDSAARWFMRNIVDAVKYLHQHSISHGDLKPQNFLLARVKDGVVAKLSDFGASRWHPDLVSDGVRGTAKYHGPEVLNRIVSRRRLDIWALGVSAMEMVSGQTLKLQLLGDDHPPLNNQSTLKHHNNPSAPNRRQNPSTLWWHRRLPQMQHDPALPPGLPPDAEAFIAACLRVDPQQRLTAHRLAELACVAKAESCPLESRTIQEVLSMPLLEWEDDAVGAGFTRALNALTPGRSLPRGKRHSCLGWAKMVWRQALRWAKVLDPRAAWAWVSELEEPFLAAELEQHFHQVTGREQIIALLPYLRIAFPLRVMLLLPTLLHLLRTNPPLFVARSCVMSIGLWIVAGKAEHRAQYSRQFGIFTHVLVWQGMLKAPSLIEVPFACMMYSLLASMSQYSIACMSFHLLTGASIWTARAVVSQMETYDIQGFVRAVQRQDSYCIVCICCSLLASHIFLSARLEQRARFRQRIQSPYKSESDNVFPRLSSVKGGAPEFQMNTACATVWEESDLGYG